MTPWPQLNYSTIVTADMQYKFFLTQSENAPDLNNPGSWTPPSAIEGYALPPNWQNMPRSVGAVYIPPQPGGGNPPSGPVGGFLQGDYGPGAHFGMQSQGRVGFACTPAGDKAICAWSSPIDNKIRISWRASSAVNNYGQYQWQEPIVIEETSFNGVDVCFDPADNYAVIIVWAGTDQNSDSSGTINYANMNFLDAHFSDKQTLTAETANGCPAVCVNNDFTFIAWTGTDGPPGSLNVAKLGASGIVIGNIALFEYAKHIFDEQSTVAPRLTWLDGPNELGLTWLGTDGRLNLLVLDPDSGNGTKYITTVSPFAPVCAPTLLSGPSWYLAWVCDFGFLWLTSNESLTDPMGSAWNTAVGLVSPNGQVFPPQNTPEPGVSLTWALDDNPDGLLLAYCGGQSQEPCVNAMSLDQEQWG